MFFFFFTGFNNLMKNLIWGNIKSYWIKRKDKLFQIFQVSLFSFKVIVIMKRNILFK